MLKRGLPWVIVALGLGVFMLLKATRPQPPAVSVVERVWPVSALEVTLGTHRPEVSLYGEVVAPDRVTIRAPLSGRVAERPVSEGSRVAAGQLLVALDQADIQPLVSRAEAEVARLEAELAAQQLKYANHRQTLERESELLDNAHQQLERMRSLVRRNLASQAELDTHQNEISRAEVTLLNRQGELQQHPARVDQLEAQLVIARANLAEAQRDAERARAHAEQPSVVTAIEVAVGERVGAGDALLDVIPLDSLEIRARVPRELEPELLAALAAGQPMKATDTQGLDYRLLGMAGVGSPAGTEAILAPQSTPDWLRPGSLVALSMARPAVPRSLALPYSALYGRDRAYVVDDGRLSGIEVTRAGEIPGPDGKPWLLVKSDQLKDGQQIALTHLPNAVEGLRVAVVPSSPEPSNPEPPISDSGEDAR